MKKLTSPNLCTYKHKKLTQHIYIHKTFFKIQFSGKPIGQIFANFRIIRINKAYIRANFRGTGHVTFERGAHAHTHARGGA